MLIIIGIWSISIIATILPAFGIGAYVADVSNLGVVNFQIYTFYKFRALKNYALTDRQIADFFCVGWSIFVLVGWQKRMVIL